jgi:diguanylate cyclase (GGDEF)-like protein
MELDAALPQQTLLAIIAVQQEIAQAEPALHHVMDVVVRCAARLTCAEAAVVEEQEGDAMIYRAASGRASAHLGLHLDAANSLSGMCVRENRTLSCIDSEEDSRVDREACRRVGARSMVVTPLHHRGAPIGVLKIYSSRPHAFDEASAAVLRLLSGIISAILHRTREHEGLALRALHDALTGLANRRHLETVVESSIAAEKPFGLVFLDLDGFKRVNDESGHGVGDRVLQSIAQRLTGAIRGHDLAARIGGDEFVVLLDSVSSTGAAEETVRRLQRRIEEPVVEDGRNFTLSASAGLALHPRHGVTFPTLIAYADAAMYAQKQQRRSN